MIFLRPRWNSISPSWISSSCCWTGVARGYCTREGKKARRWGELLARGGREESFLERNVDNRAWPANWPGTFPEHTFLIGRRGNSRGRGGIFWILVKLDFGKHRLVVATRVSKLFRRMFAVTVELEMSFPNVEFEFLNYWSLELVRYEWQYKFSMEIRQIVLKVVAL